MRQHSLRADTPRRLLAAAAVSAMLGLLHPAPGGAQAQRAADTASSRRGGTVVGVVYDSIGAQPLAGATVLVSGHDGTALTDSYGRFLARGVKPGRQSLVAYHPAFDSLGLATLQVVDVVPDDTARVTVAGPSFATLWSTACSTGAPPSSRGLLFGTVRDATTGAALKGAVARVSWLRVDTVAAKITGGSVGIDAVTDATGTYYACGVDLGRDVSVDVAADSASSGALFTSVDGRRVARLDVSIDRSGKGAAASDADAALTGLVRTDAGGRLPQAIARIAGLDREVRSDSAGRFLLRGLPAGTRTLEVMAIGYEPARAIVHLKRGDTALAEVTMRTARALPEVVVRASRLSSRLRAAEERMRLGTGTMLMGPEIQRASTLRAALSNVQGVRVEPLSRMRQTDWGVMGMTTLGPCVTNVLVDGRLTDWEEARSIPQRFIAAIEIYPRRAGTPIDLPPNARACGTVAIWLEK